MTKADAMPLLKNPYQYFEKHECCYQQKNHNQLFKFQAVSYSQDKDNINKSKYKICNDYFKHMHQILINKTDKEKTFQLLFSQIQNYLKKKSKQQDGQIKKKYAILFHCCLRELLLLHSFIAHHLHLNARIDKIYSYQYIVYFNVQFKKEQTMILTFTVREDIDYKVQESSLSNPILEKTKSLNQKMQKVFEKYLSGILDNQYPEYSKVMVVQGKRFYVIHIKKKLGKGGFGQVYLAQSINYNKEVELNHWAIKQYKKQTRQYQNGGYCIGQDRQYELLKSIHDLIVLHKLKSGKNIIDVQETLISKDKRYVVYQYCPYNNLKQFLKSNEFNKKQLYSIALELSATLKLLHYDLIKDQKDFLKLSINHQKDKELFSDIKIFEGNHKAQKGIIHRDIKLNNILISKISDVHVQIKLIDWGFSKRTLTQQLVNSISCGTSNFQAPEIDLRKSYNCKSDVWSFGAVLYELLTGNTLINRLKNPEEIKRQKLQVIDKINKQYYLLNFTAKQMQFWRNILQNTLAYAQQERWTSLQLYNYINNSNIFTTLSSEQFKQINELKLLKSNVEYHHQNLYEYAKNMSILKRNSLKIFTQILNSIQIIINEHLQQKVFKQQSHIEMVKHTSFYAKSTFTSKKEQITVISQYCKSIERNFQQYKELSSLKICFQQVIELQIKHQAKILKQNQNFT